MSTMRILLGGMLALTLVGCAGSPARNVMNGKGFVCTMDNCAQPVVSTKPRDVYDGYCDMLWMESLAWYRTYSSGIPEEDRKVLQDIRPVPGARSAYDNLVASKCKADAAHRAEYLQEWNDRRRHEAAERTRVITKYGITPQ